MTESFTAPETVNANSIFDAKNLHNPLPLLRAKKFIAGMKSGEVVQILTSNPASGIDFAVWCQNTKHEYLGEKSSNDGHSFFIKIG